MALSDNLKSILIVGAGGVLGRSLVLAFSASGVLVKGAARSGNSRRHRVSIVGIGDFRCVTNWANLIEGVDAVILCADRPKIPVIWHLIPMFFASVISKRETRYYESIAKVCVSKNIPLVLMSSRMVLGSQGIEVVGNNSLIAKYARLKKLHECQLSNYFKGKKGGRLIVFRLPLVLEPGSKSLLKYLSFLSSAGILLSSYFNSEEGIPYVTAKTILENLNEIIGNNKNLDGVIRLSVISNTFGLRDLDVVLHDQEKNEKLISYIFYSILNINFISKLGGAYWKKRSIDYPDRDEKKARIDLGNFFNS